MVIADRRVAITAARGYVLAAGVSHGIVDLPTNRRNFWIVFPQLGAFTAIALEFHVRTLYVSAATANESTVLARRHSSKILTIDTVGAPYRIKRARSRFHLHSA